MDIIIIDDDFLVVNALKTIVEANGIKVLGTGSNGLEAVELYRSLSPDIALMDIRMGSLSGIGAAKKILDTDKDASILLITTFEDDEYVREALSIGCKGYILKQNIEGIIPSLNAVYSGNMVFDSKIISGIKNFREKEIQIKLTNRELEILNLVSDGLNNKEISSNLYLSEGTVRNYISNLLEKLSLRDRTQLAVYYYKTKFGIG